MDYNDFADVLCELISSELPADIYVETREVVKNNGNLRKGIVFIEKDINASPTIYLEYYYELFMSGSDMGEIAREVIKCFYQNRLEKGIDVEFFSDYESVKDRLYCKLINKDMNEGLLNEIPYEDFMDLAVVVYCKLDDCSFGNASITIRNSHLEMWNTQAEDVIKTARENTRSKMDYTVDNISALIKDMFVFDNEMADIPEQPMYVVSNRQKSHGSVFMIYDDIMQKLCEFAGEKYYVLPSSVHEFIIVPAQDDEGRECLDLMVEEVNREHVFTEEILANHAYTYSICGGFSV